MRDDKARITVVSSAPLGLGALLVRVAHSLRCGLRSSAASRLCLGGTSRVAGSLAYEKVHPSC
jgi:hypothetical protein